MIHRHRQMLAAWVLCCGALALISPVVAAQQDSPVKTRGKAVVEFRDDAMHVVIAYNYSQRNHDTPWLYFQAGVTTKDETVIHREDIALRTPKGQEIPLARQTRVGDETVHVQKLLNNAKPVSHDIASYFKQQNQFEDMQLFRLPFGRVVHDEFIVDRERVAVGPLFFESPAGAWESGAYTLIVRTKKGTAELPVTLD